MKPLLRPFALFWRYWPQLAACYLVGVVARYWAIEFAAWVGHDNDWATALTMPLVAIARLGTYVAMFLVLRRGVPALADLPRRSVRNMELLTSVVVPFLAVYVAWQLFAQDWVDYEARVLQYRVDAATPPADVLGSELPAPTVTWALVLGALLIRVVLSLLGRRLPKWFVVFRIYIDAVWVFLGLTYFYKAGLQVLVNPRKWLSDRRVVVWLDSTRAELFSHARPLEIAWDYLTSAVHVILGGAVMPLLWLCVAGIVYGATSAGGWRGAVTRTVGGRATAIIEQTARQRITPRWGRVPGKWQAKLIDFARSVSDRFEPIVDSVRIVLHGGVFALSLFVLGYLALAWLDMSGSFYGLQSSPGYLVRGMAWLLGPHPLAFWVAYTDPLALLSHLIIDPLRICLITSTFAYCLEHAMGSEQRAQQDAVVCADDIDGGGLGVLRQQEGELQRPGLTAAGRRAFGGGHAESTDPLISPLPLPVEGDPDAKTDPGLSRPVERDNE